MKSAELNARAAQPPRPFLDRFRELQDMGVRDHDMPARLGLSAVSLVRMMVREKIAPSPLLAEIANEQKGRA